MKTDWNLVRDDIRNSVRLDTDENFKPIFTYVQAYKSVLYQSLPALVARSVGGVLRWSI